MAEENFVAGVFGLIAAICAVPAAAFGLESYRKSTAARNVERARTVDTFEANKPENWLAVRGVVNSDAPIATINGTEAAVVKTVWETRRFTSNEPAWTGGEKRTINRAWKECGWGLGPKAQGAAHDSTSYRSIAVERDAIRQAAERDPSSVSGLVPAGVALESMPDGRSGLTTFVQLLLGYYEEGPWRLDSALPLGLAVTVIGRLDDVGGSLQLRPHPSMGLFLFTGASGVQDAITKYKWEAGFSGVAAALFGGAALWNARIALVTMFPWMRSWASVKRHLSLSPPGGPRDEEEGGMHGRGPRPHFQADTPCEGSSGDECVACMENRRCIALSPCGHVSLCGKCAARMWDDAVGDRAMHCPICRVPAAVMLRVFGDPPPLPAASAS